MKKKPNPIDVTVGAAPAMTVNDPTAQFLATREGLIIATWFPKIADTETRRALCSLVERQGRIDANARN